MAKITLELLSDATKLLEGSDLSIDKMQELSAQAKQTKDDLQEGFDDAGKASVNFNKAINETTKSLSAQGKIIQNYVTQTGNATAAQKAMEKELIDLAAQGKRNTIQFQELSKAAASLKDTILDTRGEIRKMASDTKTFDKIAEGGRAMAAGFSIAAGASALLGGKNEDLQRSIQKAQGAMTLLLGAQELANIATTKGGFVTGIATAAQNIYSIAVGSSTGALKLFRLALLGTGIGALVLIIYEAANAFGFFNSEMEDTTEKAKENKKAIDELAESYDGLGRKTIDTDQVIGRIKTGMDITTISTKELKAALTELQKQLEEVQSEKRILGMPGSQFFKDSKEAASAETKELIANINAIKAQIEAREKLGKVVERVKAQVIDLTGVQTNFNSIADDIIRNQQGSEANKRQLILNVGLFLKASPEEIQAALAKLSEEVGSDIQKVQTKPVEINLNAKVNILTEDQQANLEKFNMVAKGVQDIVGNVASAFTSATDIEVRKNQELIDSLNKRVAAQETALAKQQQLQEKGLANSVATEKKRLDTLHKQQEIALEKQRKLAKERQAIDAVTQTVSLITASAQIFSSLASSGPVGIAIAGVTIAAMFAAFLAAQIKAADAAEDGFYKGGYTGDGDPRQVSTKLGNRGYKYHKKEFVFDEEKTEKHRNFFEALHKDDKLGIIYGISDLLKDTGVSLPDPNLPRSLSIAKGEYDMSVRAEANEELKLMRKKLEDIEASMNQWKGREKEETVSHGSSLITKKGNRTVIKSRT